MTFKMYAAFLKIQDTLNDDLEKKFFTSKGYFNLDNWLKFVHNEKIKCG